MRRWEAHDFGEPAKVMKLNEAALPRPCAGEARVRVKAAGVALPDLMMVRGSYPLTPRPPVSPGQEVVGIVVEVGDGFPHPVGAWIVGNARFDVGLGGLAEQTIVTSESAYPLLEGLAPEQAVGFPGSFHVAHIGLHHRAQLAPGEVLLVVGGAGRTGSAAIQLGKAMGATVVATARTELKEEFCFGQGADYVVNSNRDSLPEAMAQFTDGRGADVVYDTVGGAAYRDAVATFGRPGGRAIIVGFASGTWAQPNASDLLFRDYSIAAAISLFRNSGERDLTLTTLSTMVLDGRISPPITAIHSFDDAPAAIAGRADHGLGQTVVLVD